MLADVVGDRWVYRRDHRITRPLTELTRRSAQGIPYLAPDVQLLFKARTNPRPKDEHDYAVALPLLDAASRQWLTAALGICAPEHPWVLSIPG
jgi:hypothetical protein